MKAMLKGYRQALAVHFVYGKEDAEFLGPYMNELIRVLTRDSDFPISHRLDIPIFTWTYDNFRRRIFVSCKRYNVERVVYFFFVGKNLMASDERRYLENMSFRKGEKKFVIALDNKAFDLGGPFKHSNCLRFFDWNEATLSDNDNIWWRKGMLVLNVAKNIYRVLQGKKNRLSVFLSHAKSDKVALRAALDIKRFLDGKTTINDFFDATCIEDGENFEKRIVNSLADSAVVCIHSDHYAESMWCSKEVIISKKSNLPMLAVDCSGGFIDRVSPYAANVPCVCPAWEPNKTSLRKADVLNIARAMVIEAVRFKYISAKFSLLKADNVIPESAILLSRAPEPLDVLSNVCAKRKIIFYPEPPLASVERFLYEDSGFKLRTITSSSEMYGKFKNLSVGISVSDVSGVSDDSLDSIGKGSAEIKNLVVDVSRSLLFREAELIYGGDVQPRPGNNFTKILIEEWYQLSKKYELKLPKIRNYVAWTLRNIPGSNDKDFMSDYQGAVEKCEVGLPKKISVKTKNVRGIYPCVSGNDFYVWARALTLMRKKSIAKSDARICAGGRCYGAKGTMPGVLEEILLAVKYNKPLYLMGGFGGVCKIVASILLGGKEVSEAITTAGQCKYTQNYSLYVQTSDAVGEPVDLEKEAMGVISPKLVPKLAKNSGLAKAEYEHLLATPFAEDCTRLILRGLERRFCTSTRKARISR